MGRKNSRVQRSNARPQYRTQGLPPRPRNLAPVPIEKVVVPRGKCFHRSRFGKLRFTEEQVDTALKHAQHNRALTGSGKVESRYYKCEDGCGDFHLTSRAEWQDRS